MLILKPFTSNTRLITLCSWCHHSEFVHSDKAVHGHEVGPCLFNACKCWRFVLEQEPTTDPQSVMKEPTPYDELMVS